jgi:dethiobiotin synthetase
MQDTVQADVQAAVDEYMVLYRQYKATEDALGALRKVIEPYMKECELTSLPCSDGSGRIDLSLVERPVMNARYTSYAIEDVAGWLTPSTRKKCVVEVIDKEKLEALCQLGEVPAQVLDRKVTRPSYSLIARPGK